MYSFSFYFILFIMYSSIGWCLEVTCKLLEKHRFINRGFLIGPYCPIYGWGCLGITIFLSKFSHNPILLFIMTIIYCSILEYFTSYIMEKLFNARWWDYSKRKYNLNGRICAETMIPFGIFGLIIIYIVNPIITKILLLLSPAVINILSIILFIIFISDNIISIYIMVEFRKTIKLIEKDGTEEITKHVKQILLNKNYLYKRLIKAFPNIKSRNERLKNKINKLNTGIKNELGEIKNKIEKKEN